MRQAVPQQVQQQQLAQPVHGRLAAAAVGKGLFAQHVQQRRGPRQIRQRHLNQVGQRIGHRVAARGAEDHGTAHHVGAGALVRHQPVRLRSRQQQDRRLHDVDRARTLADHAYRPAAHEVEMPAPGVAIEVMDPAQAADMEDTGLEREALQQRRQVVGAGAARRLTPRPIRSAIALRTHHARQPPGRLRRALNRGATASTKARTLPDRWRACG